MPGTSEEFGKFRVTFLGTGTSIGVPVIACDCEVCKSPDLRDKRFRSSLMIEAEGKTIVIDCGPDFRIQMLRHDVQNLDAILFTHEHRDHIAGLDDVRAFNYVLNKKIDIYGNQRVMDALQVEFPYIFSESRYFGAPQLSIHGIDHQPFLAHDLRFEPIEVMHDQLPVFGYRFRDFCYITDASAIPATSLERIRGSKIIVLNALRNSKHVSHFSLQEAVDILCELQPERAYLTHMSHFIGLHERVNRKLPEFIRLAFDGLQIEC